MHKLRTSGVMLALTGLAVGLIGWGVAASMVDSASVTQGIKVGTLSCQVSSTDPHVVVNGNSVTINLPDVLSSSAGNAFVADVTVANTGSIPALVHWTFATGGSLVASQWQPAGAMGYSTGTVSDNMTSDLTLAPNASHTYGSGGNGVGFIWAALDNSYLDQTASVTYTAHCGEVPPPPASKVQFIGIASEAGHAALTLPAGSQPGDLALVLEAGSAAVATPTGYTLIANPVAPRNATFYRFLVAGDTAVPAAATTVTDMEVAIYRNVSAIGSHTYISGNSNSIGLSGGSPLYYPAKCNALDGVAGPAMTNTSGSSWVACMGYDAYASTDMNQLQFSNITSVGPPYVLDGSLAVNRSSGNSDVHVGLADSSGGVAAWPVGAWGSPGDNFPLPGTHGVAIHTIELLSS